MYYHNYQNTSINDKQEYTDTNNDTLTLVTPGMNSTFKYLITHTKEEFFFCVIDYIRESLYIFENRYLAFILRSHKINR